MKPPPFLIGAALVFWGYQTDFHIAGIVMAAVLESAQFVKLRWEFSNEDFSRIWVFCSLLFLSSAVYAFTANNGPSSFGSLMTEGISGRTNLGGASSKTAVLLIRWTPMAFFLFVAAQTYSNREGIPLETISMIMRRRWRAARKSGRIVPESRTVNVGYPYLILCLVAACSHPPNATDRFFWGFSALIAWALWPRRSRRFGLVVWAVTMVSAIGLGYGGQFGLMSLKVAIDQYNPNWLGGWGRNSFDPLETRTEIGQVGQIKTSHEIAVRLETQNDASPPPYLREATYRIYKAGIWYAGGTKNDFGGISEIPANSQRWPLVQDKTNMAPLNIACYLPGQKGLLPLPTGSGRLEQLPAFVLQKNSVGAVRAEGPGLVIFNALYGAGPAIDAPPDSSDDMAVTEKEKPALDQIISEMQLKGRDEQETVENVSRFFAGKFTYSLLGDRPRLRDTNTTALAHFLLRAHSGHCEYFASATVLLLRELGIPARYTVGYAVHEYLGKNKFVVRQSDAHAWCRLWNREKLRWEDFDTTPGAWIAAQEQHGSPLQSLSDAWSRFKFELARLRWGESNLREYILWFLGPVLALLLYQIIFRSGRRRARGNSKSGPAENVWPGLDSELYQLETQLVKRGFTRGPAEPLSAWLQRIAKDAGFSETGEALRRILVLHYRYRFDPRGLTVEDRESLRVEVTRCAGIAAAQNN